MAISSFQQESLANNSEFQDDIASIMLEQAVVIYNAETDEAVNQALSAEQRAYYGARVAYARLVMTGQGMNTGQVTTPQAVARVLLADGGWTYNAVVYEGLADADWQYAMRAMIQAKWNLFANILPLAGA
jgi:hypothetical protein